MAKEGAAVAMVASVFRTFHTKGEHKVGQLNIFDEGDVVWAADFRLVVTDSFV